MAITLEFKAREKKKTGALRRSGVIPATLYGPEIDSLNIQVDAKAFSKLPIEDYNHLIQLKDEKEEHEALIKNIQRDFLTRQVLNIEFYKIKRGHKLTTKVALKFVGDSEAVRMGADLVIVHKEIHVRCLPKNIPNLIEVDISALKDAESYLTIADLKINKEDIEILDPSTEIICKAEAKRKDHTIEEVVPVVEAAAPSPEANADKKD